MSLQVLVLQPPHWLRSSGRGAAGQTETSPPQRPAEEDPRPGARPAPPGGFRQQLQPEGEDHMRARAGTPSAVTTLYSINLYREARRRWTAGQEVQTLNLMKSFTQNFVFTRKNDCWTHSDNQQQQHKQRRTTHRQKIYTVRAADGSTKKTGRAV